MSDSLNEADMIRVLAIMADFEKKGYQITFESAVEHMANPDAILKKLIAEKPVIDNSEENLSEKRLREEERLVIDLSDLNDYKDSIDYDLVHKIVSGKTGNSTELLSLYIQEFLIKHPNGFANSCVAGGASSSSSSSSSKTWECEICTFDVNVEPNDICVCCGDNRKLNSNVPVHGPFRDANNRYINSNGPIRSSNNNDCPGYRNSSSSIGASKGSSDENSGWTCECTYVNNPDLTECEVCETKRVYEPSTHVKTTKALSSSVYIGWTCKACTFLNEDNSATNCRMCMENR